MQVASSLRKRLTTNNQILSPDDAIELRKFKTDRKSKSNRSSKQSSAESVTYAKSSSRDSSDLEIETYIGRRRQKNVSYRDEEKSQLICYKDNTKVITIKNDSRHTRYNTFDMKCDDRKGKLVKYKSLDIPDTKTVVKYLEPKSKVSISAEDFTSDYKATKFDRKRYKHDIITDTVDAWAKKGGKYMFSNLKNSLFKNNAEKEKDVLFKPLVFGGTYPIDFPTFENKLNSKQLEVKLNNNKVNKPKNVDVCQKPQIREYGPARTFDIDQPI
ncbi:uncharacterized protein LOC126886828 [Diabrotica virgifera virgifera]|uniref:Uncharacterized protein n=1 Tax=Diabrotica virgifera virgifera TaxID=50390 RepID=A0ABM5KI19_DIAVI|nr:uncharacterized protein LOC126886828 [Diabrotica virgifera virgifera]